MSYVLLMEAIAQETATSPPPHVVCQGWLPVPPSVGAPIILMKEYQWSRALKTVADL